MKKIRNKLALYAVTVSLLCFILTSSFFYFVSAYLIQENARKMGETQLSSMSRSLEELLRAIDDEAQVLSTNASVHQWLDPDRQLDGDQANGLLIRTEEILNDFILKRSKDIDLIEIIPRDPNVYIQLSTNYEYADPLKFSVLDTLLGGKQAAWVEQSSLKGQEARSDGSEQAGKLAFVRKIRSSSGQELGAVIVYARKQIWQQMLTGVRMHIQVEDIAGNLIYQDAQLQADVRSRMDSTIHQVTNSATLDYTSWRLTSYMNTDRLLSQVNSIQLVILWVGVSCFIGSVLLSVSVSHRLTAPLHRMERLVAKIIHGNTGFEDKITIRSSFWNKLLTNKWGIVTMYIVIILIPLLISVFVLHYRSSEAIQRESEAYYKDQIESVARKLDMTLLGYNNILDYLFADRTLNRLMARYVNGELLPGDWQEPMKRLTARAAGGELGLSLYNNQSESIYQSGCSQSVRLEETEPTIRNKTQWIATIYACGTHTIHFGKKLVLFENYKDSKFYDRLGSIVLGVNELQLERAYSAETRQSDMKVFVVDGQGRIVSHSNKLVIGGEVSPDWKGIIGDQSHSGKGTIERPGAANEQLVVFHKLEAANWFVVGTIAADVMEAPIRWMRTISLLLLCTNLLIMALAIYWMLGRLLHNFNRLTGAMAEVADGNMDHRLRLETGDELERLGDGFNYMMLRLKELMEDNYQQGIRRKEAELNALQAQINPHFLYNTLESINWEAMMMTGGSNKVSEMVTALSDLLRLSISHGKEIVPFGDEINHVKNYLFIQKERYSDKFDVEWYIDSSLYQHRILKLILQPLVENAIYHGIELKKGRGIIRIEASVEGAHMLIQVIDDGIGMSEEQLAIVRDSLKRDDGALNRGIGIRNVNERIQLYYGKAYGLHLFSEQGKGTTIQVRLPHAPPEERRGIINDVKEE